MLAFTKEDAIFVDVIFTIYLFSFGLFLIYKGINQKNMAKLNIGMLVISTIILSKFFEVDISLTLKGIVAILLGGAFLATNVVLSKKLKASNYEK